ncbi:hypothetical protein [Hyalangium versicolor]|uniref:hypothetical protein n=1 Tax=Hyalangium versicolor TaxID=2861190 RepID=UPI001CCECFFF|nr:hypothetical protein [Hyalangium versicolor]
MTSSASPAQGPFAAALRLLLLGELLVLTLQILFDPLEALYVRFLLSPGQSNRGFYTAYSVVSLLPKGLLGLGFLRLASALENQKVRRWAWIAILLLVVQVVDTLRYMVFPVRLSLGVPALADTTKRVGQGLLLSSGVTLVLSFFEMPRGGPLSILAFVASLAGLVYGVRFLVLVSRLRREMGPQSAAPAGPLFANA